ncbi:MAG: diguanylate cyclase [Oleiphilaceae bacterium]|nr:diguanylate cyclase [Oleiphilaceae bacterium]
MGGEEFLVLLPKTSEREAIGSAENPRQTLSQAEFLSENDTPFVVTASGGILGMTEGLISVGDLLRGSDRLLYEAKERFSPRKLLQRPNRVNSACRWP